MLRLAVLQHCLRLRALFSFLMQIGITHGRIVIEPSDKIEYDLNDLLGGITVQNSHGEVNFGKPVGKEAL